MLIFRPSSVYFFKSARLVQRARNIFGWGTVSQAVFVFKSPLLEETAPLFPILTGRRAFSAKTVSQTDVPKYSGS